MTRPDRKEARRARALETLIKNRDFTQERLNALQERWDAFERNEKSLPQAPAAIQRQLQDLRRELDRQNMQIRTLQNPNRMTASVARYIDQNPKDW